jgi:hypothetical protein
VQENIVRWLKNGPRLPEVFFRSGRRALIGGGRRCGFVDTLNDMLARLQRSFEAQRRFTADA